MLPIKNTLLGIMLFTTWLQAQGQSTTLSGDYGYRSPKKEGVEVIKLNPDSTFKWYNTSGGDSTKGKWAYKNEKVILSPNAVAKPIEIKVIVGEEAERAILYYRKHLYFKRDGS